MIDNVDYIKDFYGRRKNIIFPALLFIAVFLLFSRILSNNFVYDDLTLVVSNRNIIGDVINPVYYFTHGDALRPYDPANLDIYRPLSVWFLALEHWIFGMDSSYFHLVNLLLHSANTVLFFIFLKKFFPGSILPFAGSLFFGLHPVTTETVAWVNQQTALWSWFFSFLTLLAGLSRTGEVRLPREVGLRKIFILFALSFAAVFSKEQAVVLPLIYLLCLIYFNLKNDRAYKASLKSGWKEFGILTFSVILYLLFRAVFLGSFVQQEPWGGGRYSMFLTMVNGFAYYLRLLVWPHPLSINYDSFPIARVVMDNNVVFSALILFLIIFAAIILMRRLPLFSLGFFWVFITLLPVSNFILPTKQIINERFLYFALPGFIIATLSVVTFFIRKLSKSDFNGVLLKSDFKTFVCSAALVIISTWILIVFPFLTYARLGDWKNELMLWKHELKVSPQSWRTQKNYAWALEMENRTKESIKYLENSLKLSHNPDLALKSINALVIAETRIGNTKRAVEFALDGLKNFPDNDALLYSLGQAYLKDKVYGDAEKIFLRLSEKNNGEDVALFFAILSKKLGGKKDEEIKTDVAKIKNTRFQEQALFLIQARKKMLDEKWQEAIQLFITTLRIARPPIIEPPLWLAESFEKSGEKEKALAVYDLTFSIYPLSIDAVQGIKRLEQN